LAYSMQQMLDDKNMVRVLAACETMVNATMICSDKTGTLTKNEMTVTSCVVGGKMYRKALPTAAELHPKLLQAIQEEGALNSKVFVVPPSATDPPNTPTKFAGGNQTAASMLRWVIGLGCDYEALRRQVKIEKAYPFNSDKKRSAVLVKQGNGSRLYAKGAFEAILSQSRSIFLNDGFVAPLDDAMRAKLIRHASSMAKTGLRCLAVAYQDLGPIQYDENSEVLDHKASDESFTLLAITGIKDPLRDGVREAVRACQNAGIIVRMVTGDHIDTACFIARDAGILTSPDQAAVLGVDFRSMTDAEKAERIPNLRVLARSSPTDKEILVRWLKSQGQVVAVTGDGTNDAPALKEADVGLAMGIQGTEVAKKASHIIILDDNFATIVKSVMWGRSVYDNIRKFVQFQITINLVALLTTLVGAFTASRQAPLKAVQLLWVNLIMDTMAALALGTERPTMALLDRKPFSRNAPLISRVMWRNIIGQAVLQITIMLTILLAGYKIWDFPMHDAKADTSKHFTMIFNTFVWLQIFNEINSRKVNGEPNVFENFFANYIFAAVLFFTAVTQVLMVEVFGAWAQTQGLNLTEWFSCIGLGFLSIPWGFLVRMIEVDTSVGMVEVNPKDFEVKAFPNDEEFVDD
jgi:calcium-translocating P-type ATPase